MTQPQPQAPRRLARCPPDPAPPPARPGAVARRPGGQRGEVAGGLPVDDAGQAAELLLPGRGLLRQPGSGDPARLAQARQLGGRRLAR